MYTNKLTKQKLAAHFRRCGWIYIVGAVALIFLNSMIFTMTRPRIPDAETVRVMLVNQNGVSEARRQALFERVHTADETTRALEFEPILYDSQQYELSMAMPVKLMAGGYDLIVASGEAFDQLDLMGCYLPLDGYIAETADPLPETVTLENHETGEKFAGVFRTDFLGMEDVCVGVAVNSENPDSAWKALRVLLADEGEA